MIFLSKWVIIGSMLFFQGVSLVVSSFNPFEKICEHPKWIMKPQFSEVNIPELCELTMGSTSRFRTVLV